MRTTHATGRLRNANRNSIFIRNRLNQAVTTGDNILADVTKDTRINILDLIAVRNKLNSVCP